MAYSGLQAAFELEAPLLFVWWFLETYSPPDSFRRMRAGYLGLGERLHEANVRARARGEPEVPRRVIHELQRGFLRDWLDLSYDLLGQTLPTQTSHRAAQTILARQTADQWQARFS